MSKVFKIGEARKVENPGVNVTRWLVDKEVGAANLSAVVYDYVPNFEQKRLHYHERRESAYVILAGEAKIRLNGKVLTLGPESCVFVKPGDVHAVVGAGKDGLRLLEIWSPMDRDIVYTDEKPLRDGGLTIPFTDAYQVAIRRWNRVYLQTYASQLRDAGTKWVPAGATEPGE